MEARRWSIRCHVIVETACSLRNIRKAASYLAQCGIPFAVAHRVLLKPNQRRRPNSWVICQRQSIVEVDHER